MEVDASRFLSRASFWTPDHALPASGGVGHIPFVSWLIDATRPGLIIEVGSHSGIITHAMIQATKRLGVSVQLRRLEIQQDCDSLLAEAEPMRSASRVLSSRNLPAPISFHSIDALSSIDPGSIDLLHLTSVSACRTIENDLESWIERLTARGLIVISEVRTAQLDSRAARLLARIGKQFPTFQFQHDGGLAIAFVGGSPPEALSAILDACRESSLADQVSSTYRRLGQGYRDRLVRIDLERTSISLREKLSAARLRRRSQVLLREQNAALVEENWIANEERSELSVQVKELQDLNRYLCDRLGVAEHGHQRLIAELDNIRQSLAWRLVQKARRFRGYIIRDGRLSGKCWKAFTHAVRSGVSNGPKATAKKAVRKLRRVLHIAPSATSHGMDSPLRHLASGIGGGRRFEDLKWEFKGKRLDSSQGEQACYKILLISHSSCRTGAPLCLLKLAEELSKLPEFECRVILQKGGELQEDFARVVPTLDAESLIESGISGSDVPRVVAALFRGYSSQGIAICNTVAVSPFHEAFEENQIPVLSWVHELPTMVDLFGGSAAARCLKSASRQLIVPANIVRDAWIQQFEIEPEKVLTLRYGVEPKSEGLDRQRLRGKIRRDLGIPENDLIVLGCGTVDLRKGADLFTQVARRLFASPLAQDIARKTWFVWVGDSPTASFHRWLIHDANVQDFPDRVIFTGQKSDTVPYYLSADVFALTSREDPCPFANLEAMESGLPVVVFQDAGGAPEVIGDGGISVPYLDVSAMTEAVIGLLQETARREAMGRAGQEIIRRDFTWKGFTKRFTEILREAYGLFPPLPLKVSVIVPNYRHAPYLEERLTSIFRQTVLPHEIIVLDDASPDESISVINRMIPLSPVPIRLVENEANSGSTFRQWMKGLELATGDLIWLAESDDSCHPRFLERLLPEFYDSEVALAYCQSELIGADGRSLEPHFLGHTEDLCVSRWRSPYRVAGATEAEVALSQKNTIPNASAMIFRKPRRLDFLDELYGLRFAGDWLFHAMLCRDGKVAYVPDVLNRYRRHEQTVSHRAVRGETYLTETLHVKRRVFETFDVTSRAMTRSLAQTMFEYHRLCGDGGTQESNPAQHPALQGDLARIRDLIRERVLAKSSLRVLLVLDEAEADLKAFSTIHLANALAKEHTVFVCNAQPDAWNPELTIHFDSSVLFIEGTLGSLPWLLAKQHEREWSRSPVRMKILDHLIELHAIDVIDSRSIAADELAGKINARLALPWLRDQDTRSAGHQSEAGTNESSQPIENDGDTVRFDHGALLQLAGLRDAGLDRDLLMALTSPRQSRLDEFVIRLACTENAHGRFVNTVETAVKIINRLPESERGGRRVRLVVGEEEVRTRRLPLARHSSSSEPIRNASEKTLRRLLESDTLLVPEISSSSGQTLVIAALSLGIPVMTTATQSARALLADPQHETGRLLHVDSAGRCDLDEMVDAIMGYLVQTNLLKSHQEGARALFASRFAIECVAARYSALYRHLTDPLASRRVALLEADGTEKATYSTRQSA